MPRKLIKRISLTVLSLFVTAIASPINPANSQDLSASKKIVLVKTINGAIAPKSVEASNSGLVSAHNMMYRHSVTLYGNYLYFTNYAMYGKGFNREGTDTCSPSDNYDKSFLSRVDLSTKKIDAIYPVGSVPKVVKVSPDNKYILVSNWCSYTVTIISVETQQVVKTIKIGRYPRGIAITSDSKFAYVAEMGGNRIHQINLEDFSVNYIPIGSNPRAIVLSPDNTKLYATLNISGKVIAWDLATNKAIKSMATGKSARSLAISTDGSALYVVNFRSGTLSVVSTETMKVLQNVKVCSEPIGVTYDQTESKTWVACYGGSIKVFAPQ